MYAPWWYRLLGARVGRGTEISTALGVVPDMLTIGADSFVADGVMLGDERIEGGWMSLRIVMPMAMVIAVGYLTVALGMPLAGAGRIVDTALALALAGFLYGVGSFLFVVLVKWLVVGRYRPRLAPMWTPFVWASEAVTNLYESIAVPNFVDFLRGTPMLPPCMRLLGCKTGKGIYMDTIFVTEFDCVNIGDYSALNGWCGPQTHLFEDHIMKFGDVHIGRRCHRRATHHHPLQCSRR